MNKKFYISTAISYTSAKPHIGNTYEAVLADSIARYKRLTGYDVYFQTGTDEHGIKIQQKAEENNTTPKQYVDNLAGEIKKIWDKMNVSYDKFVRTTDKTHEEKVAQIFEKLYKQGDIYKGEYEGWYCVPCESFFTESELIDGKCPDCGRDVSKEKEEAYFFKLSKYQDRLREYINENPDFIQPESRKNEMLQNFLNVGLKDLCVSRTTFDWGVKVPFDSKHVVYVWLDALTNYITFLGYNPNGENSEEFNKYWPCDIHLIGKDILRFHTIYWPIMLMALNLPLPKQIFGHPWILFGEDKMSKSKGNILYADDLVNEFGVDAIRYYLLHEIPYANDGSITYELLIDRINSDLANILGNLVNRTISMSQKYFDGIVYEPTTYTELDLEVRDMVMALPNKVKIKMDDLKVADAIDEIFEVLRRCNKYIDETTPWILAKENNTERLKTVLYTLLESIRSCAVLLQPFLPDTADNIFKQLNTENRYIDSINFKGMDPLIKLNEPTPLFLRIDKEKKLSELV